MEAEVPISPGTGPASSVAFLPAGTTFNSYIDSKLMLEDMLGGNRIPLTILVDAQGKETPRGVTGELVGRGDNVMMGYWNRPAETAEALRDGWMHTQDLGFMDEGGFVYITDRAKDMIVTGAENVYSIEVESLLSRHPAIAECAVIGVPDKTWGERVHAVVVPRTGEVLDLQGLQSFLRGQIAGYKIPKSLEVHNDPLPRSAAGKILKTQLREPHKVN